MAKKGLESLVSKPGNDEDKKDDKRMIGGLAVGILAGIIGIPYVPVVAIGYGVWKGRRHIKNLYKKYTDDKKDN